MFDNDGDESTGTVIHYNDDDREDEDDFSEDDDDDDYKSLAIKNPKQTKPRKTLKEIKIPSKVSFKDDHEEEHEFNKVIPELSGLASHNVSVGEEDANQGTVAALSNFKALSLHTSPTSTEFGPGQPFPGFRFENTEFHARKFQKHPSFVIMIKNAITIIDKEKGVSIIAIKKWILGNHPEIAKDSLNTNMKKAIKKGMEDGTFKRPSRHAESLGSSLTGSLVLGSTKTGLVPKPKIRKPVSKKTTKNPSVEKTKQELSEDEGIQNQLDEEVDEEPLSKALKLPKKTKPRETAKEKTSKKPTLIKVDEEAQMTTAHDEELENKENQSPVKQLKKKTTKTATKKSKATVSKVPKVPKSKKAVEADKEEKSLTKSAEKPLTRSAEKLASVSRRLRSTK